MSLTAAPVEIELLAPAGSLEIGIEAINAGADAVYIGAERFGARKMAGNSLEDIERLVTYAHRFGCKVYVTLNTIVYDDELEEVRSLANRLCEIGVDALITQDLALREMNLPIPLHASTQMDNRSNEDIKRLYGWGYEQVVLARELGLEQMREIHEACPKVRLEAFVHGALCVSYSGRCFASQHCFNRSANRGECAQFCRLAFDLEDEDGRKLLMGKHLLSLKDLNRSAFLEQMLEAGVSAFKIEGRLKDVAYVKNVTAAYSVLLDGIVSRFPQRFRRLSYGRVCLNFEPDLAKTFNRGYTDYFLCSKRENVAAIDSPKATGEAVGEVKQVFRDSLSVSGTTVFHNGDGLCFFNEEGRLEGFRVNRVVNNRLFPFSMPKGLRPKMPLFRNHDQAFVSLLEKGLPARRLFLRLSLSEWDEGFVLGAECEDGRSVELRFEALKELARSGQADRIKRELGKLGDSCFVADEVDLRLGADYFIPASTLSAWRRNLVAKLMEKALAKNSTFSSVAKGSADGLSLQGGEAFEVANEMARSFLRRQGVSNILPAFELERKEGELTLMTSRHCVRYTLGLCGKKSAPLFLRLADGRRFALKFDCRKCEMRVCSVDNDGR